MTQVRPDAAAAAWLPLTGDMAHGEGRRQAACTKLLWTALLCTHLSWPCADAGSVELVAELRDVAHGQLVGTPVAVGRVKISPPAWPDSKQHTLAVSWVENEGVSLAFGLPCVQLPHPG